MLEQALTSHEFRIEGQRLNKIPVDDIENRIRAISQVEEATVFSSIDGHVKIQIKQMTPKARVFNANGESYYIDSRGVPIQLSTLHAARLVSVTSDNLLSFNSQEERDLMAQKSVLAVLDYLDKYPFWKQQIVEIHLDMNNEIELTPRIGNHKILIGNASDLRTKFDKLWAFYQNCEKGKYWNAFSLVNLKYKDQIVCTKK